MWPFSKKADPSASPHAPVLRALAPWLDKNKRLAWKPKVADGDEGLRLSQFGGLPRLRAGETAIACLGCNEPIDLFLQLDGRETPAGSPWTGPDVLQLFYCTRCEQDHDGWSPFSKAHLIRVVPADELRPQTPPERAPTFAAKTIVGWEAFGDAPGPEEQGDLGVKLDYDFKGRRVTVTCAALDVTIRDLDMNAKDDEGRELAEALSAASPGDKLGGWPYWIQGVEYPSCPRCQQVMRLVFQIDSEDNVDHMFGDAGCGHITRCPEHPDVLAFAWACS